MQVEKIVGFEVITFRAASLFNTSIEPCPVGGANCEDSECAPFCFPLEWLVIYEVLLIVGAATPLRSVTPVKFSLSSLLESALPAIQPLVEAGSRKCETLKSFFGLTYEQMMEKNGTDLSVLNIDLVTRNGNIRLNSTSTRRLSRIMEKANTTVILIHGFMESSDGLMVQGLAPELLKKPGFRVLALDGRRIISLEYFRSSTYARLMGESLGDMLSDFIKKGQDPSSLTMIGHSLGAHIAGIAGKRVLEVTGQSVGRILGLDPAGPCFGSVEPARRLHSTDAANVDVIHTNAGILGLNEPVGDRDFYPNGGMSQPGCYLSTCDHSRAWELLAEAILAPDHFPARKCTSWPAFRDGLCSKNELAYLGVDSAASSPGLYFLSTSPAPPYGLGPAGSG